MPQSTEELRALMVKWFGSFDPSGPEGLLRSHGFISTPHWQWMPPTPAHSVSRIEELCVIFLIEEWDWGGLIDDCHLLGFQSTQGSIAFKDGVVGFVLDVSDYIILPSYGI